MGSFNLNGKAYETHENGYVDGWDKEAARYLAKEENVDLSEERWRIVDFLREYYLVLTNLPALEEYKITPMMEILIKAIGKKFGSEKANTKYLNELFPGGLIKQACKIAGIPKPTGSFFELDGKIYGTDERGYLDNFKDWSKKVADYIVKEENMEMTDAHWEVVNFVREYYEEYNQSPPSFILIKEFSKKLGQKKTDTKDYLCKLFSQSPAAQACKIAGLPIPQGCH